MRRGGRVPAFEAEVDALFCAQSAGDGKDGTKRELAGDEVLVVGGGR